MPIKPIRDAEITFVAVATVPTFRSVAILDTATGGCKLPAAAAADPLGVALADATASKAVTLQQGGIAECIASAAIAAGDYVEVANTLGQVRSKTKAGAGAQPTPIVGRAHSAAAAVNDIVFVQLMPGAMY
ncbi:MAG: DUF2190 family protein [Chloroflexota bacterium]|nr:DUF2190 family protein [Chloroflexota bacterium]